MKVLVCGGRDLKDQRLIYDALDDLDAIHCIECVVHGDARGADRLGRDWARHRQGVRDWPFPADWDRFGKGAGPIRNLQMLKEAQPDLVVAFPGGAGTQHMMVSTLERGVTLVRIK